MNNSTIYGLTSGGVTMEKTKDKKIPDNTLMRDTELPPLEGMSLPDYVSLHQSGYFWEFYPDATGSFQIDCCGSEALF